MMGHSGIASYLYFCAIINSSQPTMNTSIDPGSCVNTLVSADMNPASQHLEIPFGGVDHL
jgi:hypothetical protein